MLGVSRSADLAGQSAQRSSGHFSRFAGLAATAAVGLGVAAGGALLSAGTVGIRTAANMETANIGFTTMLGSGQKAQAFLSKLQTFAAATPFEFPELQTAASSLISAGINANKVIPIMTSLGNATSGMGTGSEGVKRATVALQQMNAAGKITGQDLNQLRDAGIPVYDLLSTATGKSKASVAALAQAGKLGSKELGQMMAALESGKGLERFSGLMDKQSQSLVGLWSTLKDTFSQGMAAAIGPAIPLIKQGLGGAISFTAAQAPHLASALKSATGAVTALVAGFRDHTGTMAASGNKWAVWGAAAHTAAVSVRNVAGQVAEKIRGLFPHNAGGGVDFAAVLGKVEAGARRMWPQIQHAATQMHGIGPTLTVAGAGMKFLSGHIDTVVRFLPLLLAGIVAWRAAQALGNAADIALVPVRAAGVIATFASASANRALATAISQQTGAQTISSEATGRSTVGLVAQKVAAIASAAASKAMAAGQWLLNAAMTANPIGLVVAAIALLVVGFIYAYKKSETFRDIVIGVFDLVKIAVLGFAYASVTVFKTVLQVWLETVGGVLHGARLVADALHLPGRGALDSLDNGFRRTKDSIIGTMTKLQVGIKSELDKTIRNTAIQSALTGIAMTKNLGDRLPAYRALAQRYGMTLDQVLTMAKLPTGQKARLLAISLTDAVLREQGQTSAAAGRLASIPRGALAAQVAATQRAAGVLARTPHAALMAAEGQLRSDSYSVGAAVSDGLAAGIRAHANGAMAAAQDIARGIAIATRAGAQVMSPSRLSMYTGHMIGEGLVVGLQSRERDATAAGARLGAAAAGFGAAGFGAVSAGALARSANAQAGAALGGDTHVHLHFEGAVLSDDARAFAAKVTPHIREALVRDAERNNLRPQL